MTSNHPHDEAANSPRTQPRRHRGRVRSEEQWESIKPVLHEMLMAGKPLGFIANVFDKDEQTIRRWRNRMYEDMREEEKTKEPRDYAMEVMGGLRAAAGEAWLTYRGADNTKAKVSALGLYLKAVDQQHQFNQSVGVYGQKGALPLHPAQSGEIEDRSIGALAAIIKDFVCHLQGEVEGEGVVQMVQAQADIGSGNEVSS
ncbi:hypothetical protein [Acidimangrovimonas sediminis]|uniref:hypothetical protein n=1 Tax=Acidimangrovimonas sediminis TaxID=2056283 RepID=UPI0011AF63DF|nr:hypothetical protein [Acidimangrovimonas sediminis]